MMDCAPPPRRWFRQRRGVIVHKFIANASGRAFVRTIDMRDDR